MRSNIICGFATVRHEFVGTGTRRFLSDLCRRRLGAFLSDSGMQLGPLTELLGGSCVAKQATDCLEATVYSRHR